MTHYPAAAYLAQPDYQQFFCRLSAMTSIADARPPVPQQDVFQKTLIALLPAIPGGGDHLLNLLCKAVRGFNAIKTGEFENGYATLELVMAATRTLPTDAKAIAETLVLPMISFYYYRKGEFTTARSYADRSIALCNEWQCRYPLLHIHRIQQLFDLSRIDMAEGRYEDGLETIRQLVNYLATGTKPALPGYWHESMLGPLPTELIAVQFMELVDEITFLTLKRPDLEPAIVNQLLADVSQALAHTLPGSPSPYSALLDWVEAKRDLLTQRHRDFLLQTTYFLEAYSSTYDQMKFSLIRDLDRLLTRTNPSIQAHSPHLAHYVNSQLRLPARLVDHIRASRQTAGSTANS